MKRKQNITKQNAKQNTPVAGHKKRKKGEKEKMVSILLLPDVFSAWELKKAKNYKNKTKAKQSEVCEN